MFGKTKAEIRDDERERRQDARRHKAMIRDQKKLNRQRRWQKFCKMLTGNRGNEYN
jgi:hypothetical protein